MKRLACSTLTVSFALGLSFVARAESGSSPDDDAVVDSSVGSSAPGSSRAASPASCPEEPAWTRCAGVIGELFAGYRDGTVGGDRASEFLLDRAEVRGEAAWREGESRVGGVVARVEAIRSAGPQSLFGIDGDSIVFRVREAYGHGGLRVGEVDVSARLGLVPERWLELVRDGYDLRALDPLVSDLRYFDRSDLGATATASAWDGLVSLDLSVVNGEGLAQRELNHGKNTTLVLSVRPLRGADLSWSLHGAYRDGSIGLGSARNHRLALASTVRSTWLVGGGEYVRALGLDAQGDRRSQAASAWLGAHVLAPQWGLAGKYDWIDDDIDTSGSGIHRVSAGVFADVLTGDISRRLRLYLAYQHERYGDAAGALPGAPEALDVHRVLVQMHARADLFYSDRE